MGAPMRILVLHGKGDTEQNFSEILQPLQEGLKAAQGREIKACHSMALLLV